MAHINKVENGKSKQRWMNLKTQNKKLKEIDKIITEKDAFD